MKKIGVLSDTHGFIPKQVYEFFAGCDEIWHAGDIGSTAVLEELRKFKPVVAVWGNMDSQVMRYEVPQTQLFSCEGTKVLMTHIGGYPGHYERNMIPVIESEKPQIFVSGHSHILRVMYDKKYNLLHINPGAAGKQGFHIKSTLVRFDIKNGTPENLEINEFPK